MTGTAGSTSILLLKFVSSLSFMFFWRPKEPKAPSPALGLLRLTTPPFSHPVRCKLRLHYARLTAGGIVDLQSKFTSRKRHPSVGCCLPLKAIRCHSGAPGLVRFSIINKKNNAAALQTGPRLFPECQRPLTVILMVPVFFDISIARAKVREVSHCKGNPSLKAKTAP